MKLKLILAAIVLILAFFLFTAMANGQYVSHTTVIQGGTKVGDNRVESERVFYDLRVHDGIRHRDPLAKHAVGDVMSIRLDPARQRLYVIIYGKHSGMANECRYDILRSEEKYVR